MAAQTTTNLGLTLADQTDAASVATQNGNFSLIDAFAGNALTKGTAVTVGQGGTGAATAKAARTNLKAAGGVTTSWGTSLAVPSSQAFVICNYRFKVIVWCPSTQGVSINVTVGVTTGSGSESGYAKTSSNNSITFGNTSSENIYTITRTGNQFTISRTDGETNDAFMALFVYDVS